jgi:hypothetical protein
MCKTASQCHLAHKIRDDAITLSNQIGAGQATGGFSLPRIMGDTGLHDGGTAPNLPYPHMRVG